MVFCVLQDLMHELRSLESDLEALKEAQREEWSEISPGDDETDPLGIALSTAEVLKHNVKRSSDTVQVSSLFLFYKMFKT